ncbi:beta-1,3-galactosyltransferase 6-like [Anneissia japonica]|uniref:beta-1,3-galactosyltransferase 6-like n=1 Tax=Anneissia japonica TaxID=1529436 RepID=UPI00142572FB|nr:beta-1,3-galactosyltransferase 6-like [Anneissia japonica]
MRRRQKPFWQINLKSQLKWQLILLVPPVITFIGLMLYISNSYISTDCACPNSALLQNEEHKQMLSAFLVVLIMTGPNFFENRQTIRETWFSSHADGVLLRFVIGAANLPDDKIVALTTENNEHQDLLLLTNLEDSYYALTSKLISMYEWLDRNVEYSYVLKADDDTFVQLNLLLEELKEKPLEEFYWGFFDGRAHVHYAGKWAEKEFKLCDRYIPYALGGGYVLSKDLVNFVARNSKNLKRYKAEDVALGSWIAAINVNRVHDPRFDTEYKSRGCSNEYLVTHKQSQEEMRSKHYNLQTTGKLCRTEVQTRMSYIYNWDVLPSKCCERKEGIP